MRTECMICDGCGKHDQINQTEARNAVFRMTDYIPDRWVLIKDGSTNIKAYHDMRCAYRYHCYTPPEVGADITATQLAMFNVSEAGHEGE